MRATQFLSELEQEFVSTQKLLETVPESRLAYKPHEKAMSLGQLALHVASIPGRNMGFAKEGQVETSIIVQHPIPNSKQEILEAFKNSKQVVHSLLGNVKDSSWLDDNWKLLRSNAPIAEMPTHAFLRTFVLNHFIHHRGELTTYLRMLDQKIPSVYGPSADINPFQ